MTSTILIMPVAIAIMTSVAWHGRGLLSATASPTAQFQLHLKASKMEL